MVVGAVGTGPGLAESWNRSIGAGLSRDDPRRVVQDVDRNSALARVARQVLAHAADELEGQHVGLILADRRACIVDLPFVDESMRSAFESFGLEPGLCLSEELVGTNAVGTPVVIRQGQEVRGEEHFASAFRAFSCFGHPILHPITGRLEGVLTMSGLMEEHNSLMVPFVRRMVAEIEERLQIDSTQSDRVLLDAFQVVARAGRKPVVVVGRGLVLATPAALDMLDPADHAIVRGYAENPRMMREAIEVPLVSGRRVSLHCRPIEGSDGVLVEINPSDAQPPARRVSRAAAWPCLVVGEAGSGRTTAALDLAGQDAEVVAATDVVRVGESAWANQLERSLSSGDGPVVIEDVHLLSEAMSACVAEAIDQSPRPVVMTTVPTDPLGPTHVTLAARCCSRKELVPLRRRPQEIPQIAQRMLSDVCGGSARLTGDTLKVLAAQPWPGNLSELRRVVVHASTTRSIGDIVPSDLPETHRGTGEALSPLRVAEREVIQAAIENAGGNKVRAARELGVSRSTLYNRMKALRLY